MTHRFAAIGLDHRHIYDLVSGLLDAGMECAGYWPTSTDQRVLEGFHARFPQIPENANRQALLEDPTISVVVSAAVPKERAALAIDAMRFGKDVLVDKPGVTTEAQLAEVERMVAETGRIFSVCFSERFLTPSTEAALRLVREGKIGRVIQTIGLGPHRLNRALRPGWFWNSDAAGGILVDIASHQIDQFIAFTGSRFPEIAASSIGAYASRGGFDDFGEILLRSECATGYLRVDWFTADGLPTWGDGRLLVLGTKGTIELRKYIDVEGRPGTDHLIMVNQDGTQRLHCEGEPIGYFRAFAADVANRTETAMPQSHVFTVCRLALEAQAQAVRVPLPRAEPVAAPSPLARVE